MTPLHHYTLMFLDLKSAQTNSGFKTKEYNARKVNFKSDKKTKPKLPMNHRFSCNKCNFIGTDMEKMKSHIKNKHNKIQKEKTVPCPLCGQKHCSERTHRKVPW